MVKKVVVIFFVISTVSIIYTPFVIHAEDIAEPTITKEPSIAEKEPDVTKKPEEIRNQIKKQSEELKKRVEEEQKQKKLEMQKMVEEKRKNIVGELQNKREQLKEDLKDKFEASRESFMKKLQEIKDERKKKILENVSTMMDEVNKKRTDAFLVVLEKLSSILVEMNTKAEALKASGEDTTAFNNAFTNAKTAIETAKKAVTTQAEKKYIVNITTEDALKNSVGTTRKQLEADLRSVHEIVKSAKEAVMQVARELHALKKENKIRGTITPTVVVSPTVISTISPSP